MRSSTSRSIAPSLFLLYKMQSLELTHLKYDPNPFLVFSACQFWLPVSITSSSWENKAVSVLNTDHSVLCSLKNEMWHIPLFQKPCCPRHFRRLGLCFWAGRRCFLLKKRKEKKSLFTSHAAAFRKAPLYNKTRNAKQVTSCVSVSV